MSSAPSRTGVVILGAGPSSLLPLFQAARSGGLDQVVQEGVTVLERAHRPGPSWFPSAKVDAQNLAIEVLECIENANGSAMAALRSHGATRAFRQVRAASEGAASDAPRAVTLAFLAAAVTAMLDLLRTHRDCHVLLGVEVTAIQEDEAGRWTITVQNLRAGESRDIAAAHLWNPGEWKNVSKLHAPATRGGTQRALAPVEEITDLRRRLEAKEQRIRDGEPAPAAAGTPGGARSIRIPALYSLLPNECLEHAKDANALFECRLVEDHFDGVGACVTVNNATTGLMLAIREVLGERPQVWRKYALMPSFTDAAAAQAALWCGLTPLLCDVDPETWLPSVEAEETLLRSYAGQIAVVMPSATFGNNLDLERYAQIARRQRVPVVVDAAASLGSESARGQAFGKGFEWPIVFSMHASTAFSTAEGGVMYCADRERLDRIRQMSCFGLDESGCATMAGLNARLPEAGARAALVQLDELPSVLAHQAELVEAYARELPEELAAQRLCGAIQARGFVPVLLPESQKHRRGQIIEHMSEHGVRVGTHFSPHLAEQPYLQRHSVLGPLGTTEDLASRILTLPLLRDMTTEDVRLIARTLAQALKQSGDSSGELETVA